MVCYYFLHRNGLLLRNLSEPEFAELQNLQNLQNFYICALKGETLFARRAEAEGFGGCDAQV